MKNQPKLTLADVLRRRKSSLIVLVGELGLTTYAGLTNWCRRMGVVPPDEAQFVVAFPFAGRVNSPQEGVVVLPPPPVIAETTGESLEPDAEADIEHEPELHTGPDEGTTASQKKRRPKKDGHLPAPSKSS